MLLSNPSSHTSSDMQIANSKSLLSKTKFQKRQRVNWHEAVSCAIQIELQDYAHLLEYHSEYVLGKNSYRIDLLVIKKLSQEIIPKSIAYIFRSFNLFEIKGIGSSASIDSYYKTIGYAGLLINQAGRKNQYSSLDISLTLLSCHYPRKLIQHLTQERKLTIAKISPGVYHVNKETFNAQIIVTQELLPLENLYLRCLTNHLQDMELITRLADDYKLHQQHPMYNRYMHQLTTANQKTKGESIMICEGLLNLYGTSSEEIIERTKKEEAEYYLPKLQSLSNQIDYLKSLLEQNNIPFCLEPESGRQ